MISIKQIKAARALLDWRQEDLARRSGLSLAAVNKLERALVSPRRVTLDLLQQTFEQEGIEFTEGPGVRLTDNIFRMQTFTGGEALLHLLDDVFATLKDDGGDVLLSGIDESLWANYMDAVMAHQKRMKAHRITSRVLLCEGDRDFLPGLDPATHYRWISRQLFTQLLYYVYGDKFAMVIWGDPIRVTIIQNHIVADNFRRQFEMNWRGGKVPVS